MISGVEKVANGEGEQVAVPWDWVKELQITYAGLTVPRHAVHDKGVSSLGGNTFYGSFSLIYPSNGGFTYYSHGAFIEAHPTAHAHTEPQYFLWLDAQLDALRDGANAAIYTAATVLIMEMNQTNTPCSLETCRKEILRNCADGGTARHDFGVAIARMGAYQIYESQAPKVCPSSFDITDLRNSGVTETEITESRCLHRVPEHN